MSATSMAGQIASLLEEGLAKAGRHRGLNCLPASTSRCFFEDPLGAVLGAGSPRCDAIPGSDLARQPLWQAMVHGSYSVPGIGRKLHFYEIAGNGIGNARQRRQHLQRVAVWVFFFWLHWDHRTGDRDRFDQFCRVVLGSSLDEDGQADQARRIAGWLGPYSRIFLGYLKTLQDIALEKLGTIDCPLQPEPAPKDPPFQHRFATEPMWVDALARLAPRAEAAVAFATPAQILGQHGARRDIVTDWSWGAAPSPEPVLVTVNSHRCSPGSFRTLVEALRFDRWLALERRLVIDPNGGPIPPLGIATRGVGLEEDMQTPTELLAREEQINAMSARLSVPIKVQGSLRYAPFIERDTTLKPQEVANTAPQPGASLDPALRRLLEGPRWDLDPRMMSRELDPQYPGHVVLSVRHDALLEQFEDPDLGVLVHIEVKSKGVLHRGFALSHAYEPPVERGPRATGRLLLEVQDAAALPFFGTGQTDETGGRRWVWKADCSIVPGTGEPVILLRIEM